MRTILQKSENTAITYGDFKITYSGLLGRVQYYYNLLKKIKAEKIVIYSENRPEFVYVFYAGWKKNAIMVPVDHLSTPDELLYILKDCKPEVIFTSRENLAKAKTALKKVKHKMKLFILDDIPEQSAEYTENINVEDISRTALIIYTSGTTGSPKGVMLSFENLFCNVDAVVEAGIYREGERILVLLPLHHILPILGTMFATLCVQSLMAISPSIKSEDIISTLVKNRITIIIGVPRFYEMIRNGIMNKINASAVTAAIFKMAKLINSRTFSKILFKKVHRKLGGEIKYLVSGGAALNTKISYDFNTLGFDVLEGYGMTESAPMITFPRPGKVKIGTTGQAMPGVDIEIRNGEICARGKNVMQGYYKRPEETAQVIKKGWLHTGDLGELDNDGYLTITGRKKEIIVLANGKNVNPVEIEEKLVKMSSLIKEAGVFLKDGKLQVIIHQDKTQAKDPQQSAEKTLFDLISGYNNSVSPYKKLLKFSITHDELPKTRLGKIKRFELANLETTKTKERTKEPTFKEYILIKDYLEAETGNNVFPDDHIEFDLGLDSLSKVGLLVFLENSFGIKIKDDHLSNYPNLLKLSEFVRDTRTKLHDSIVNWADILREKVHVTLPKTWYTGELFKYVSKGAFKLWFKLNGYGHKNLPKPPFILAPNHQSFFDGMYVTIYLRRKLLKNTYFYAKSKHVKNALLRFIARKNNVIVVDLTNDLKGSIQKLAEVLKKGKNIIIFPEGTRTKDGDVGEFKQTFAILSREIGVPVVPVAINGAYEALPTGSRFPKPGKKISVDFLPPVFPKKKSYSQIANEVKGSIVKAMQERKAS
ncbi:MAG: AMP-binding protein [Spirochaetota bacterium]